MDSVSSKPPESAPVDLEAAVTFLTGEGVADTNRVAVVGTSIGANLAVLASLRKWARAAAALSPRTSAIEALAAATGAMLRAAPSEAI